MQRSNYIILVGALCLTTACSDLTNGRGENPSTPVNDTASPIVSTTVLPSTPQPNMTEEVTQLSYETLEQHSRDSTIFQLGHHEDCQLSTIQTPEDTTKAIQVFFGCRGPGKDVYAPPARNVQVPDADDPKYVAIEMLLTGPTDEERQAGYYANFSEESKQIDFEIEVFDTGLAVINFDSAIMDVPLVFVGSADSLQIIKTLGQFPDVDRVTILINGEPLSCAVGEC